MFHRCRDPCHITQPRFVPHHSICHIDLLLYLTVKALQGRKRLRFSTTQYTTYLALKETSQQVRNTSTMSSPGYVPQTSLMLFPSWLNQPHRRRRQKTSGQQYHDKSSNPAQKPSESTTAARDKLVGVGQPGMSLPLRGFSQQEARFLSVGRGSSGLVWLTSDIVRR